MNFPPALAWAGVFVGNRTSRRHPRHGIRSGVVACRPRPRSSARACWRLSGSSELRVSPNAPVAPVTCVRGRLTRGDLMVPSAKSARKASAKAISLSERDAPGMNGPSIGWASGQNSAARPTLARRVKPSRPTELESTIASGRSSGHALRRSVGNRACRQGRSIQSFRERSFRAEAGPAALRLRASRSPTGR